MKNYRRTTITIPENIYRSIKTKAAFESKSVSRFITDALRKESGTGGSGKKAPLPFSKYDLGAKNISRRKIYESHLRGKVSR